MTTATETRVQLPGLIDLMETRKVKKLFLGDIIIKRAAMTGRNPGALYVTDRATCDYMGKVTPAGFWPSRELEAMASDSTTEDAERALRICDALARVDAGGAEYVAEHGRASGQCGFCGLRLDDPESVERGYGPVCARNHGLPHGNRHGF